MRVRVKIQENKDWNPPDLLSARLQYHIVKIQENKDWNSIFPLALSPRFPVKIQENKDWNAQLLWFLSCCFHLLKSKKTRIETSQFFYDYSASLCVLKSKKTRIETRNISLKCKDCGGVKIQENKDWNINMASGRLYLREMVKIQENKDWNLNASFHRGVNVRVKIQENKDWNLFQSLDFRILNMLKSKKTRIETFHH